jgi:hypothetical protein
MADFCLPCTEEDGLPGNDFAGWLGGLPGYAWGLCEGCGRHRFNDAGDRECSPSEDPVSPVGGMHPCIHCYDRAVTAASRNAAVPMPLSVLSLAREVAALLIDMTGLCVPARLRRLLERIALRVQAQR